MQEGQSDLEGNRGDFDLAILHLDNAIVLTPTNSRLFYKKANYLIRLEQFQEALQAINLGIEFTDKMGLYYLKKAEIFHGLSQLDSSSFYYNLSIQNNQNPEEVYESSAKSYMKLALYDSALSDINKAIQINPNYIEAYNTRGDIYYDEFDYENAINDYTFVIDNSIDDDVLTGSAFVHRGGSFYRRGNLKLACEDWKLAVELGMNQASILIDDFCN
ncbi:tetratricopeptide repeat protein [Algoriphagus chordae]|uniref:Tetratricopeptide repeat protein n=1 Tax=Algoriphagus chordae TaxID=237019 RepID=A0A2W7QTK6_9BACT|nr:hypothetical protein [Algoriphagus chordae]PZX51321.1 tetratricopeptide repeat protein [Algoriphagus chordae]